MKQEHKQRDDGRKVTVVTKEPSELTAEARLALVERRLDAMEKKKTKTPA